MNTTAMNTVMQNPADDRRRCRIVAIDEAYLLEVLRWGAAPAGHCVKVKQIEQEDLPADVRLDRICYSEERRAWLLFLTHPSFDLVPPSHPFPTVRTGELVLCREDQA